ncbi:TetR/AcrR family transcriptional regulator [Rathayibacter sp. KR2-224]|uniref:TetR/AcrR family transcriptional regulator n=1 Tax=Rathayibacter sp. KR2-224 TaxID=3400913 RepID=UPI003C0C837F
MTDEPVSQDPALPHAVALSWGVAERPQRGPKRELSIERIVETAIEIADAEGLGAVSMARVASALGFTTMSLYRYVTSKDDLLLLMQDAVAAVELPEPPENDWRTGLRQWMLASLDTFQRHPWYSRIPVDGVPKTPNVMRLIDTALRTLRSTPLRDEEKMACVLLMASYVRGIGDVLSDIALSGASDDEVSGQRFAAALAQLVTPERFPDLAPIISSGAYTSNEFDDFDFGLERMLDGIQRYIEEREAGGAASPADQPAEVAGTDVDDAVLYGSDKRVKEAAKARREAEKSLRDARKREREALRAARERVAKERERKAR